jgi:hypothetical protein
MVANEHYFTYDVFLSHSAKDKAVVRDVAERLRKDGVKVWFDEWVLRPGDSIPAKIEEGLDRSRVLVLCMSANAFGSDWAQLESGTFRFRDPLNKERRFLPLRLDDTPIKGSLAQFSCIEWRADDREQEYAKLLEHCIPSVRAPKGAMNEQLQKVDLREYEGDLNIAGAISRALRVLLEDQFDSKDAEHQRGGWSKSYCTRAVPLAFSDKKPEIASLSDSVTVTHWIVRGLACLRELQKHAGCLTSQDNELLTKMLMDVRSYLNHHYQDGKGGVFRVLSQQEERLVPDVRHSATLAKALLALSGADDSRVGKLLNFVVKGANDPQISDHRIPTHAEVLAAIECLAARPKDPTLTNSDVTAAREIHEEGLLSLHRVLCPQGPNADDPPRGLFFDSVAGEHMAPFYTWWALDCYGLSMSASKDDRFRSVCESSIVGLLQLEQRFGQESGFPLTLDGLPDAGATAQIADLLARLDWQRHSDTIKRCLRFVTNALTDGSDKLYWPFTIWSYFSLLSSCMKHRILRL